MAHRRLGFIFFLMVGAVLFCGCTSTNSGVSQPPVSVYSLNRERSILQNELKAKSSKRFDTKNADEAERLAQEMRALTDRIAELEADIASAERRARETRSESQTDSGCIVGPNGGKYKITKSGKKNYGAC